MLFRFLAAYLYESKTSRNLSLQRAAQSSYWLLKWYYPHSRMRSRSTPITTVITGCAKDTRKKTRSHPYVNYVNGMVWNRTSRFMQSIAHKIAVIPSKPAWVGGKLSVFNGVDETYRLAVYKVWRPTKKCCTDCKECHHLLSCMSSVLDEIRLRRL